MPLRLTRRKGSQLWWITGTVSGVRIRESSGTTERQLAQEACAVREAQLYRTAVHGEAPAEVTFASAAISYAEVAPRGAGTSARLKRLLVHFGPLITCRQITQTKIDGAAQALLRPSSGPATRTREIVTPVRAVLLHAARRGWCSPPTFEVSGSGDKRTEWLSPKEVDSLIDAAAPHLKPLITFMVASGARVSEALSLEWRDVDLKNSRAILRDVKDRAGRRRDRLVDLCPRAVSAIETLEGREGSVFRTRRGDAYADRGKLAGGQIKTGWAGALRRVKLSKNITPHGTRHTWASWHYAEHRDLLLLKRDGGWSSVSLVERYAHLAPPGMVSEIVAWRLKTSVTILAQHSFSERKTA